MTFDTLVEVKTTVQDYPWLSMVAEIGGYVGLLLGVAVVDTAAVVEHVVNRWRSKAGKRLN